MTYIVEKCNESYDEQRAYFTSAAKTEGGIVRAARNALAAKYGEDAWLGGIDIHDICMWGKHTGRSPIRRFDNEL